MVGDFLLGGPELTYAGVVDSTTHWTAVERRQTAPRGALHTGWHYFYLYAFFSPWRVRRCGMAHAHVCLHAHGGTYPTMPQQYSLTCLHFPVLFSMQRASVGLRFYLLFI